MSIPVSGLGLTAGFGLVDGFAKPSESLGVSSIADSRSAACCFAATLFDATGGGRAPLSDFASTVETRIMVGLFTATSGLTFVEADVSRLQSLAFHASFVAVFTGEFWLEASFVVSSGWTDVRFNATGFWAGGCRGRSGRKLLFIPSTWIVTGRGSPARRGFGGGGCDNLLS